MIIYRYVRVCLPALTAPVNRLIEKRSGSAGLRNRMTVVEIATLGPYKARLAAAITAVDSIASAVAWATAARVTLEFVLGETNITTVVGGYDPFVCNQNVVSSLPLVHLLAADTNFA